MSKSLDILKPVLVGAQYCHIPILHQFLQQSPTKSPSPRPSLSPSQLRDFITNSLYHPTSGYFSRKDTTTPVVGYLPQPIQFNQIPDRQTYLRICKQWYSNLKTSWLTPAEIFTPHYGASLASYIASQHNHNNTTKKSPLHVYELGGGTGTLARDILNTLRDSHPSIYQSCRYRSIEISPRLGQLQHDRVCNIAGHSDIVFSVWSGDASVPSTWQHHTDNKEKEEEEGHCWIIATEVLDNLSHDCIIPTSNNSDEYSSSWNEVMVGPSLSGGGELEEQYRPLGQDALILECFKAWTQLTQPGSNSSSTTNKSGNILKYLWNAYANLLLNDDNDNNMTGHHHHHQQGERVFLPTGALQLLKTISTQRPNHTLVLIDFDQLPDVQMKGYNAPIVSSTIDGEARDAGHYLDVVPGTADIFFPTDFDLLSLLYKQSTNNNNSSNSSNSSSSCHAKCSDFFSMWQPKSSSTKLMTGYNPMIQDYSNTAIFIGKSNM